MDLEHKKEYLKCKRDNTSSTFILSEFNSGEAVVHGFKGEDKNST